MISELKEFDMEEINEGLKTIKPIYYISPELDTETFKSIIEHLESVNIVEIWYNYMINKTPLSNKTLDYICCNDNTINFKVTKNSKNIYEVTWKFHRFHNFEI